MQVSAELKERTTRNLGHTDAYHQRSKMTRVCLKLCLKSTCVWKQESRSVWSRLSVVVVGSVNWSRQGEECDVVRMSDV